MERRNKKVKEKKMRTKVREQMEQSALSFRTSKIYKTTIGYCQTCFNTGVYMSPVGEDDYYWNACTCGLRPLKGSEEEYQKVTPY